jgi:hypothetical protein
VALTFRELEPEEFDRVPTEALDGLKLGNARVSAAFEGDKLVGVWCVVFVLHAEPIWVREDHRGHPTLIRRLWDGVKSIVRAEGLPGAVAIVPDSVPEDARIAEWIGAKPIPGAIYLWMDDGKE